MRSVVLTKYRWSGIYILVILSPGGGEILSKLKNREEFEGGLMKKGREKGERKKQDPKI